METLLSKQLRHIVVRRIGVRLPQNKVRDRLSDLGLCFECIGSVFRFIPCAFRSTGRRGGDDRNIRARRAYVRVYAHGRSHSRSRILRR